MVFRTFIIYGYFAYVNLFYAGNFKGIENSPNHIGQGYSLLFRNLFQ